MEGVRSSLDVGSTLSSPFVVGVTPGKVPAVYSVVVGESLSLSLEKLDDRPEAATAQKGHWYSPKYSFMLLLQIRFKRAVRWSSYTFNPSC